MAWGPKKIKQRSKKAMQRSKANAKSKTSKRSRPKKAAKGWGKAISPVKRSGANTMSVAEFAKKINAVWHRGVVDLLETDLLQCESSSH